MAIVTAALLSVAWLLAVQHPAARVAPRAAPATSAAGGILRGEVTSGHERLGFANALVIGTRLGTQTDGAGRFVLSRVPTGRQRILFMALGHSRFDTLLDVVAGDNPPVHVDLVDLFPPPSCQPCFWVNPNQGTRALPRGAVLLDYVGEVWQARVRGRSTELVISSDPDPCELRLDYYLRRPISPVRLSVIDSAGGTVRMFDDSTSVEGHHLVWDGSDEGGERTPYGWYR